MTLVTRAEVARRAGVSRAAVTKAARGALGAASVGRMIDVDHPAAAAYLSRRGRELGLSDADVERIAQRVVDLLSQPIEGNCKNV
jgi:hypothetical protein